ncbi:MAG: SCP2 sterol-binding domain-containing protein [Gammaproteobacteria bacterium]|nr:SCP2 sterol-binding domain-containing protein [Gammaproteobacteria bacterium]
MTISAAAYATLEILLNQAIRLDPEAKARLAPLHGQIIKLELLGLGLSALLIPDPSGIQVLQTLEAEPDCVLRGTPLDLARMRSSRESADQLFSGAVEIEGDSAVAHRFGEFLSSLDIDWEEQLSHLTGDVIAHEVGNLARDLGRWGNKLGQTLGMNLQEYLQEELRLLPNRYQIEPYLHDVDRLRDDVERLSARIDRLRRRLADRESAQ